MSDLVTNVPLDIAGDSDILRKRSKAHVRECPGAMSDPSDQRETVLQIVYKRSWGDNRVTDIAHAMGLRVETRCPRLGDPLPRRPEAYAAVVVGGGLDRVGGDVPYMAQLPALAHRTVSAGTPYFGICLGAQVLSVAFGGTVRSRPDGVGCMGYRDLTPTPAGRARLNGLRRVLVCHSEVFTVPPAGERLAYTDDGNDHAFRIGDDAIGVQFHPEITPDRLEPFMYDVPGMLAEPGSDPPAQQNADAHHHDPDVAAWLKGLLTDLFPAGPVRRHS